MNKHPHTFTTKLLQILKKIVLKITLNLFYISF